MPGKKIRVKLPVVAEKQFRPIGSGGFHYKHTVHYQISILHPNTVTPACAFRYGITVINRKYQKGHKDFSIFPNLSLGPKIPTIHNSTRCLPTPTATTISHRLIRRQAILFVDPKASGPTLTLHIERRQEGARERKNAPHRSNINPGE